MLPLIHSPATAPKTPNEFSSAKDIIERERIKKQANALLSEVPDSGHKHRTLTYKETTDGLNTTELPAMIINSPPHGQNYHHPNAVSTTTRTIGGVGMTVTSFSTHGGRPVSRAADTIANLYNDTSPRSSGNYGYYGKPSATEISLANATLIYAEAWRPGMQNVRRRRRSSARSNTHSSPVVTNPRSNSPTAIENNPNTGPQNITSTSNSTLLTSKNILPSLPINNKLNDNRQSKRTHSPEQITLSTDNKGNSLTRAPRLSVTGPRPTTASSINNNGTTALEVNTTTAPNANGRPSSQQNSRNPVVSSPLNQRQPVRHSTNNKDEPPSKGSGLYAYLLPPANLPELNTTYATITTINVPPSPNSRNLRAQLPYDNYNDTEMDVDDSEILHFMWEGSPYLQSVGNHRLHRSRTPATNKKRRGSRRPKQDSNGSNSDRSPSPSHTKNPTNNTSPGNHKDNTNVTVLAASPMRTAPDSSSSTWSTSSLAGTQSALQASLASSMVWVLGPQGQPVSIPTTLYMGQVLAAGAAGLPMPQLVPPPPLVVSNVPPSSQPVTESTVSESKSIESVIEVKLPPPEPETEAESKTEETKANTDNIVGTAYLADVKEHTDGKINLSLEVDVASLPTSARAVLSSHPSFRLVLVTEETNAPITVTAEDKTNEPAVNPEPSFITPNLIVEEPSQTDVPLLASNLNSPGRTMSPERRTRSLPPPPPVPPPVDEYDQSRAQALARSVLMVKIRTANSDSDGVTSRRASGVGGLNLMGFNTSGFVPSSPRALTGAPAVPSPAVSYLRSMAASIIQSSPTLSTVSETATAIFNAPTVASVAAADADVASYLQGLPAELKHAYPTRLLVSLVSDLCEEILSVNSRSPAIPSSLVSPLLSSTDTSDCFYTADLASAWLWFLQFARDIRCSWASGTRWAASRRIDRAQHNGPWSVATSLKEEAFAIIKEFKPVTGSSTGNEGNGLFAGVSGIESTIDSINENTSSLAQPVHTTDPPTEATAVDTSAITGLDYDDKNSTNDSETLFVSGVENNDAIAEDAVKAAVIVYEPLGDVVQEDHILRLLKRVPFPSLASKTLFVRTALAFAGWGCLNVATATVMKTHLEEAKVNSMTDNVSRPQSRGIGATTSSLHYDKNNVTDDFVAEEMAIVEAVLLEPVTLVPGSMVGTYTESGVRIGPGMVLTPAEAKAAAANAPGNMVGGALIGGPSLPSPSSTIGRGMASIRNAEGTFAMGMNSQLRGGIMGIGGNFSNAPNTIVDGMKIISVFDAPAWRALQYVRGRACSPHSLTAILSTPADGLALHYAFVRQCLTEVPTLEEFTALGDAAVSRATYGVSPSGATIKEDPHATAEDLRIFAGCPNPPGRQYYPTRYLLALVRSVIAAATTDTPSASIPDTELPDVNSALVKAAWFLFLQLRMDMNATWATAVRWLEAASPGVVNNSLPNNVTNNSYPPGSLNAYIPFGEVAQMDHLLRLLSKLALPTTEAKALFVRTALAFAGWGALEDASATIMRSHLDELALDQQENANNNKTSDSQSSPEPYPTEAGNENGTNEDVNTASSQDIFQATFSFSSISGFTRKDGLYFVAIVDSSSNAHLYRSASVTSNTADKVSWSPSHIYVPSALGNESIKSIAVQVWFMNTTDNVIHCIGTSKSTTLSGIIEAGKQQVPLTLYSTADISNGDLSNEESKLKENDSDPLANKAIEESEAQGFLHIGTDARFSSAPSLAKVLSKGLQLTATFAIDFTSGNGVPFSSDVSLHSSMDHQGTNRNHDSSSMNGNLLHSPYATALAILASLVRKLNTKSDIHALGFGAIPALEDITTDSAAVSVIPIRPSTMDILSSPLGSPSSLASASKIANVSVLMDAYATAVTSLQPGTRRLFQPILDSYLSMIETNHNNLPSVSTVHNIFFILTNGESEDEESVAQQISSLPVSLHSTIVIVCIVPSGTDQAELTARVNTATRFVERIIQLRRDSTTLPILYNDIICVPYSPGDSTEDRTIAGAILSSSVISMLSESIIENVVVSSSPVLNLSPSIAKVSIEDTEAEEKRSKENDEKVEEKKNSTFENPISVDAAMVRAEAALTAPIRLVSADHARIFGKGGVGLQKGCTLGITDVGREIQFHNRFPSGLDIPSTMLTNESKAVLYNPATWSIFLHVRERVSSDNNLAMLASTPPEALLVHYNFLRGCLTAPACFDKAGFEAQETEAWTKSSGATSNRKRDQEYDSDLTNLLNDRVGMGILLTNALRNEISILLGVSPLRATVSTESTAVVDPVVAHPSDLDGTPVKVVLLVAKADGRSPMIDPVTKQPIMVRSVVPLEQIEMVMAQLGKSSRRQLGPVAALTAFSPHP